MSINSTRKRKEPEIDQDIIDATIKINEIMIKAFDDMMAVLRPLKEKAELEALTKKPKKRKSN